MNKLIKYLTVGGALLLSASVFAVDLENVSTGAVKPGEWNGNFAAAKAYAEANGMAMFVFWSNPGCAKCNKAKTACNSAEFVAWRQSKNMVFAFSEGEATVKAFAKNSSGHYPYMRIYWPAKGVDVKFSGRSGEIPGTGSTVQAQLMSAIDKAVGGGDPVGPVGPVAPVIGPEWSKARKLTSAVYGDDGALKGYLEVKAAKISKSGSRKGYSKISAKLMGIDGKSKSFKAAYAKVGETTAVTLSGVAGTASLKIAGSKAEGTVASVIYGSCTAQAAVFGGMLTGGEAATCTFGLDAYPETCDGFPVIKPTEFLPLAQKFTCAGSRLAFPRKGTIRFDKAKNDFVMNSMDNPSGLKLSYKPNTGFFKGTFGVYVSKGGSSKKKYSATVTGFIVNGAGEGIATVKKVGTYACTVTVAK